MLILAGDIGGTKTDLILAEIGHKGALQERRSARWISADFPDLLPLLRRFLGDEQPQAAAFGIAGPVVDGRCRTTNLPWQIDQVVLGEALGLGPGRISLLNDFHALALSLDALPESARSVLQIGDRQATGVRAIIGAGTGLGEAVVLPTAEGPRVLTGEGGHADFAPRDPLEQQLLTHLLSR
ncbi:MAG TPA: glucokinase, partial [Nannocystis exedens]|nr:glucokinase [Nannocystis exedens]